MTLHEAKLATSIFLERKGLADNLSYLTPLVLEEAERVSATAGASRVIAPGPARKVSQLIDLGDRISVAIGNTDRRMVVLKSDGPVFSVIGIRGSCSLYGLEFPGSLPKTLTTEPLNSEAGFGLARDLPSQKSIGALVQPPGRGPLSPSAEAMLAHRTTFCGARELK